MFGSGAVTDLRLVFGGLSSCVFGRHGTQQTMSLVSSKILIRATVVSPNFGANLGNNRVDRDEEALALETVLRF
jgi:hypothetical protein